MDGKISLFEIDEQIMRLVSLLDEDIVDAETGEVLIDVWSELDKLNMKREDKILNIARYIDDLERENTLIKDKVSILTARAKSKEKQAKRLKDYVLDSMLKLGTKKIEDETVVIKLNSTKVVNVFDEQSIPQDYINTVVEFKPDKRRILADLKSGKEIAGVELGVSNSGSVR